ncbi:MAG: GGDEF domain-containing protein [Acidobacteria bacterium]|nr:GGDEF domain-containing protein [Acidobacteriota bacterium]
MKAHDPQVTRALDATAKLLGRKLALGGEDAETAWSVVSRLKPGIPRVGIRDLDRRPFGEEERDFLKEVADLMLNDIVASDESLALEQRLRLLEKENVELSMKNRALAELSSRDALTGLFNRWYVLEKIEAEMNRCLRHGSPMSLLILDIDNFRRINETHGHVTGDQVLQTVGRMLRESCRIYDIPGRYGGEEFCLMLPETSVEKTMQVAERLRQRVAEAHVAAGDGMLRITASIGLAGLESVPDEAIFGATALVERADRALGTAKDRGRNRVEAWSAAVAPRPSDVEA